MQRFTRQFSVSGMELEIIEKKKDVKSEFKWENVSYKLTFRTWKVNYLEKRNMENNLLLSFAKYVVGKSEHESVKDGCMHNCKR